MVIVGITTVQWDVKRSFSLTPFLLIAAKKPIDFTSSNVATVPWGGSPGECLMEHQEVIRWIIVHDYVTTSYNASIPNR